MIPCIYWLSGSSTPRIAKVGLATELGGLTNQNAEEFKESLDVVVRDTPRTQIGASKLKNLLSKVGVATAQSIRELIVDITSETAKKIIWPDK